VVNSNKLKEKHDDNRIIKMVSVLYSNAMLDSLNEANDLALKSGGNKPADIKKARMSGNMLLNLWNYLKISPFEAHMSFMQPSNRNRPRIRTFLQLIWKQYY
jgi:hypothetical protein